MPVRDFVSITASDGKGGFRRAMVRA